MNQKKVQKKTILKKRELPPLGYTVHRLSDYQTITNLRKTKKFVFLNLIRAIKDGIDEGVEQVGLVKLKGSNASILLNKSNWKPSLNNAILFFTESEEYENCQKCKDLLEVL